MNIDSCYQCINYVGKRRRCCKLDGHRHKQICDKYKQTSNYFLCDLWTKPFLDSIEQSLIFRTGSKFIISKNKNKDKLISHTTKNLRIYL